jgi:hypothetical protein
LAYAPATFTFYCTGQMMEKKLFDAWINLCVPNSSGLVSYRDDESGNKTYESDITVTQYDQSGNETYYVDLIEAYPVSLSQMGTNWGDDSPQRLTVTFNFTKWKTEQDYTGEQANPSSVSTYTNAPITNLPTGLASLNLNASLQTKLGTLGVNIPLSI